MPSDRFVVTGARTDPRASPRFVVGLQQTTNRITAAIPVAKAIIDGRKAMNKLQTLATIMADRRKNWDDRAQVLLDRVPELDSKAETAFNSHETALNEAETGFKEMEDAVRDLAGGNGRPLDGGKD